MTKKLLSIKDLSILLPEGSDRKFAIQNVNLELKAGETVCVVGESGSGKSLTAKAIMGLLPAPHVRVGSGEILFNGEDLVKVNYERLRQLRGSEISMIFQEPMTALNPVMTIGSQIDEIFRFHAAMTGAERREKAIELLNDVQLPDPKQIVNAYAHELSGGQRQRAMIAMALALSPKILIADEPTTALDVTTQAQILKLIKEMQSVYNTGVLFITHDFGVVAQVADKVGVMKQGKLVELGETKQVLRQPKHEYSKKLISSVPENLAKRETTYIKTEALVTTKNLDVYFPIRKGVFKRVVDHIRAVDDVSVDIHQGQIVALVGESGSGKSLTALSVMQLLSSQLKMSGSIVFEGVNLVNLTKEEVRKKRGKDIAMIFQEPMTSLNPVLTIGYQIEEAIRVHENLIKTELNKRVEELLSIVGIPKDRINSYPDELSGGQRQRVMIAMAISCSPKVLIADEPTTALDVTVQAQILNLLNDLKLKFEMTMLFITHDFGVVEDIADEVAVMYQGEIVEQGTVLNVLKNPKHPYTKALLDCVPDPHGKKDLNPIDYSALKRAMR